MLIPYSYLCDFSLLLWRTLELFNGFIQIKWNAKAILSAISFSAITAFWTFLDALVSGFTFETTVNFRNFLKAA